VKRTGRLYKEVCDLDNCKRAIIQAASGKRKRRNVKKVLNDIDAYAKELQHMLITHSYVPSPYSVRYINDGIKLKRRRLAKARFWPDQCVHHALDGVMERIMTKGMDYYCCGSVKGRGPARAKKGIERYIKKHPEKSKYVFKMDVRKYYDSICHEKMMGILERKIKDKEVLWLYRTILDSYDSVDPDVSTEEHEVFRKGYGIPIGIDPSRWLCNLYLEEVDHDIRKMLGKDYFCTRYIDDIVVIGPNKRKLSRLKKFLDKRLLELKLHIKSNWQIFRLDKRPIDFLGFKFYKDAHTEIRKTILKRIKRKIRKLIRAPEISVRNASCMISYMGWVKGSNSHYFIQKYLTGKLNIKKLRRIISNEGKILNKAGRDLARSA